MSGRHVAEFGQSHEQAVRTELDRLLESQTFRTSKRCREFLAHIVERTIQGRTDTLKERSLGVELFKLPPDFDTGQHTVVRVTANEVRKKLAQHYVSENGAHGAVRVTLPPGSYNVEFQWDAQHEPVPAESIPAAILPEAPVVEAPAPPTPLWRLSPRAAWMAITLAAFGFCVFWLARPTPIAVAVDTRTVSPATPVAAALPEGSEVRFQVGSANPYVDRSGRTWGADAYFTGGAIVVRPSEKVARTLDADIYRHARIGEFRYDIPLARGTYELHLHFAETGLSDFISAESSGEGQRVFRVSVNGERVLDFFDVVADAAGANIADERVFRGITPAEDGFLHLSFSALRGSAMVSAIEVLPVKAGTVKPVRIRAGWTAPWQDHGGKQWQADSYFLGGNALVRRTNPVQQSHPAPPNAGLYGSERWGHFSYAVPVPDGKYRVTLRFSEGHYGARNTGVGGAGSRLFDVYCNGEALLRKFDILKEASGEGRPVDRTFSGIRPNAQGKILLSFVPVRGMACINGIEVEEDR
jgi:hypothetical protein